MEQNKQEKETKNSLNLNTSSEDFSWVKEFQKSLERIQNEEEINTINLSGCPIGDEGAHTLAAALTGNNTLKTLLLNNCGITDDGITAIVNAVNGSRTLVVFDVSDNFLSFDVEKSINDGMRRLNEAKKLAQTQKDQNSENKETKTIAPSEQEIRYANKGNWTPLPSSYAASSYRGPDNSDIEEEYSDDEGHFSSGDEANEKPLTLQQLLAHFNELGIAYNNQPNATKSKSDLDLTEDQMIEEAMRLSMETEEKKELPSNFLNRSESQESEIKTGLDGKPWGTVENYYYYEDAEKRKTPPSSITKIVAEEKEQEMLYPLQLSAKEAIAKAEQNELLLLETATSILDDPNFNGRLSAKLKTTLRSEHPELVTPTPSVSPKSQLSEQDLTASTEFKLTSADPSADPSTNLSAKPSPYLSPNPSPRSCSGSRIAFDNLNSRTQG